MCEQSSSSRLSLEKGLLCATKTKWWQRIEIHSQNQSVWQTGRVWDPLAWSIAQPSLLFLFLPSAVASEGRSFWFTTLSRRWQSPSTSGPYRSEKSNVICLTEEGSASDQSCFGQQKNVFNSRNNGSLKWAQFIAWTHFKFNKQIFQNLITNQVESWAEHYRCQEKWQKLQNCSAFQCPCVYSVVFVWLKQIATPTLESSSNQADQALHWLPAQKGLKKVERFVFAFMKTKLQLHLRKIKKQHSQIGSAVYCKVPKPCDSLKPVQASERPSVNSI